MAGVTGVTMPEMCGLGADAFVLVYDAKTRKVTGFGGSGPAPVAASVERYRANGHTTMPFTGWWSVAVPGAVGVYFELHRRYGRIPLERLWAPAIRYAREGFPIGKRLRKSIAQEVPRLRQDEEASRIFLGGGERPDARWILKNPELARSLEAVLEGGDEDFYHGKMAGRIAEASQRARGLLTKEDLASQRTEVYAPISTTYRGFKVFQTNPPSQGLIMLEELNLLEGFDLRGLAPWDARAVHLMAEVKKLAFRDRNETMGDPRFVDAPTERLISKAWAQQRRTAISEDRADNTPAVSEAGGDTTSFVAVDGEGNAVSFIHSNSALFGSCVVVPGTGIVLNNRAGRGFVLDERHPNCLAPGKRTMHTLNTFLVTKPDDGEGDGELQMLGNTPGGDGQPQWNFQVASNVIDFGLDAYAAVAAPRWTSRPGTDPSTLEGPVELRLEERFPKETQDALRAKGHQVVLTGPWDGGGSEMLIRRLPKGIWEAAADPRDGGQALGM